MAIIRHTLAPDGDHTRAAVRRDVRARAMRARAWLASPTRRPNDLQSVIRTKSALLRWQLSASYEHAQQFVVDFSDPTRLT